MTHRYSHRYYSKIMMILHRWYIGLNINNRPRCCCCCCRPHSTNVLPAESSTRNHVAASSLSHQVARKGSTLSGFVQRSRLEREVGRDLHSNKWEEVLSCIRQSGQSGEGCRGSPMEKRYETRSSDLFVRSWARVRRVSLDRRSSAGETDGVWSWRTLLGGLWLRWLLTMWLCISLRLDWMRSSQMRSDFVLMLTV